MIAGLICEPLEFVRKITQDDFVIITNRLRSDFEMSFQRNTDPSVLESFTIRSQTGKIKTVFFKNGTLLVGGDPHTREYKHIVQTILEILGT